MPYGAKQVFTFSYGSCAVLENGEVYCWGRNEGSNRLGVGFECYSGYYSRGCNGAQGLVTPTLVQLPNGVKAQSVYSGRDYYTPICIVSTDGDAYCWGENNYGQLGNGNTSTLYLPAKVYLPSGILSEIQTMAHSRYATCGLWDNGSVFCWGSNTCPV